MPNSQNPIIVRASSAATINGVTLLNSNIDIKDEPGSICAVENPMIWNFGSDIITWDASSNPTSNIKAYVVLQINTVPTAGDKFLLSATTAGGFPNYEFEAADEPKNNQFVCSTTVPSMTTADVADSLAAAMNANDNFRRRFYAASSLNQVLIQALDYGARWDISFDQLIGTSFSIPVNNSSYDNYRSQALKDYAIWADTYIASVGDFGSTLNRTNSYRVAQSESTFNADNSYEFDVAGVLKSYVTTPIPILGNGTMQNMSSALQNIYLVFGEKYDYFKNNFRRQFLGGQTSIRWGLNSSLGFLEVNNLSGSTFDNSGTQSVSFLTNSPNTKLTYYNSHEFLCFLYSNSNGSQLTTQTFSFYCDIDYVDGTSDLVYYNDIAATAVSTGGMYCAEVSPSVLGLTGQTFNNKLVRGYTLRLVKSTNLSTPHYYVTPDRYYRFIDDCPQNGKELIFLGLPGGWDSWFFAGETTVDTDRKATTFTLPVSYRPLKTDKVNIVDNITGSRKYKLYSGYFDKQHFDWLYEILLSSDVRLYEDGILKSIIITGQEYKSITSDDLFQIAVEYVYSTDDNYIKQ